MAGRVNRNTPVVELTLGQLTDYLVGSKLLQDLIFSCSVSASKVANNNQFQGQIKTFSPYLDKAQQELQWQRQQVEYIKSSIEKGLLPQ